MAEAYGRHLQATVYLNIMTAKEWMQGDSRLFFCFTYFDLRMLLLLMMLLMMLMILLMILMMMMMLLMCVRVHSPPLSQHLTHASSHSILAPLHRIVCVSVCVCVCAAGGAAREGGTRRGARQENSRAGSDEVRVSFFLTFAYQSSCGVIHASTKSVLFHLLMVCV
jgi:hypothetical protein